MDIKNIDSVLSEQLGFLTAVINNVSFNNHVDFELNNSLDYTFLDELNYPGLYLIEIKTDNSQSFKEWLDNFGILWGDSAYKTKFVPNIKNKRVNKHDKLVEWFPLYIGRSKKISCRIKQHIDLQLDRPTAALKLKERTNLYGKYFRVSTIKVAVNNYDIIIPEFERNLRNRLNPILGRQ